jgi:hypothetical protein
VSNETKTKVWTAPDWMKPLPPLAPLPVKTYTETTREEIEPLSLGQKLALLSLSRTTRAQALWHALRRQYSAPPFTGSTFAELRELKFVEKPEGEKWHRLTTSGFRAADFAAELIQAEHKIHEAFLLGTHGVMRTLACTCGWKIGVRRGENMQRNASSQHLRHVLTASAVDNLATALAPPHHGSG